MALRLGIAGSGAIARGLARAAAEHGETVLWARREESAERAREAIEEAGVVVTDLAHLTDCELVVEAVAEDLEVKKELLGRLGEVLPEDAVIATTTSSLSGPALRAALHEASHLVFTWPQTCEGPSLFLVVTVTDQVQRRTPKQAKTSSVFKKIVMAVSGILMLLFLIAHMIGNLHVFQGAESFNHYSEWLRTVGEPALPPRTLLTAIEIGLLVSVLAHMWAAIALWRQARRARPQSYVTKKSVAQSYASRTMRWGGVIIALFIVYHILDLTFGAANPAGTDSTPYERLVESFQNPIATTVYVVTLILLGMHLRHGIWSATQTLGRSNRRRERTVNAFAIVFATLLIAGYLVVPAAVVFGLVD